MSNISIETSNLTKIYKSKIRVTGLLGDFPGQRKSRIVTAVDHLNLQVRKGELFGLLGPNGAGKTTLVKMLCTLLPPDEGTAIVNGFDVANEPMKVKQSIGTLFSVGERGFFWRLDAYRNLEFFSSVYNVPRNRRRDRIAEVLDLVGLTDNAYESFQRLSGGMKRKLALARALLPDPPVLLLDEPTTALDVMTSRTLREFIKNLSGKMGKTVLYTTHYIEEASQICDRVAIMNKGKIIALDTPEALRDMVKKGEAIEVNIETISDEQIETIKRIGGVISVTAPVQDLVPNQIQLRIRLTEIEALPVVLDFFFKEKIKLLNFKRDEPTLEDAFIELTGKGMGN
jgi:ABC-2 type transport system ATP-binding protein